ncbi:MAG: hypothetical protein ABJE47_10430 [bacterium]
MHITANGEGLTVSHHPLRTLKCLALVLLSACSAQRVVFSPSAEQSQLLAQPPMDLSVVVVHWPARRGEGRNAHAYATQIVDLLQGSGAFKSVVYDSTGAAAASADLIAESAGLYCNSAIIPLFTIVTLGIVPTIWDETNCDGVVFRPAHPPTRDATAQVVVRESRKGKAVMGWAALPLGLWPGWSWKVGRDQGSYRDAFRLAIIGQQAALTRLAHPAPAPQR